MLWVNGVYLKRVLLRGESRVDRANNTGYYYGVITLLFYGTKRFNLG